MLTIQIIKLVIDNTVLDQYNEVYFAKHPKAKKKPIEHPYHPSINQWMVMKRPMMNALKRKWKDFTVWFIDSQGYSNLHIEKCDIKVRTFYQTNRRHDVDNSTIKFFADGLVESGFVVDDDSLHIQSLTLECFVDKENPRTEIDVFVSIVSDVE